MEFYRFSYFIYNNELKLILNHFDYVLKATNYSSLISYFQVQAWNRWVASVSINFSHTLSFQAEKSYHHI